MLLGIMDMGFLEQVGVGCVEDEQRKQKCTTKKLENGRRMRRTKDRKKKTCTEIIWPVEVEVEEEVELQLETVIPEEFSGEAMCRMRSPVRVKFPKS